mgnify:FL=1
MVNKVILIGNVGLDPEVRTLESGVKTARIRLATTERIFNRQTQESSEHTEWHTVTLWRGLADVVDKYVRKGSQIYIEGSLRTREWQDQQGNKRYSTEIIANDMKLLGRRNDAQQPQQGGYQQGGYQHQQGGYQQASAQPQSGYSQPQQQNYQQPAAPAMPDDSTDDLPF